MPFFSALTAEIDFVLDYAAVSPASDLFGEYGQREEYPRIQLPWALKSCQFDETSVFFWIFNFQAFLPLDINNPSSSPNDDICHYYQELLNNSNARMIFLCDPRGEQAFHFLPKDRYFLNYEGFITRSTLRIVLPLLVFQNVYSYAVWLFLHEFGPTFDTIAHRLALRFTPNMLDVNTQI